jgi:dTDP-4-dehydrorhamnose reductase
MKVLITGASGLLGSKVAELALKKGYTVYSGYLTHSPPIGQPVKLDISNKEVVLKAINKAKPNAIIHCAALTNVDKCETDRHLAIRINVNGTKFMAEAAKQVNAYLIYMSTDYVFNGLKGLYTEEDEPDPINFYGYSKLLGERAIEEIDGQHLIARASVIYGSRPASGKTNFALWLLEKLKNNQEVKVLADQYVSPTLNANLAEMLLEACERRLTGICHMSGATRVSRYDFAIKLAKTFSLNKNLIRKAKMSDMNWIAERPRDSSLDISKARKILKTKPTNLDKALNTLKRELEFA